MANPYSMVLVTVPDAAAEKVAMALLNEKLAACVNQIPKLVSRYWWEGKIDRAEEHLLVIKTRTALFDDITECVKKNHPYSVPEIIRLDIGAGSNDYLNWIADSTRSPKKARVR